MLELSLADTLIVVFYFVFILVVGFIFAKSKTTIEEYFCAKGNIGWFVLGLAAFATNTSSGTCLGVASSTNKFGVVVLNFELTGIIACLILAYVFGPVFMQNNVLTVPEYLEKRFNVACRVSFSAFTIITHIFTKISIYILASVILLEQIVSLDIYTLMLIITLITGIYSVVGGQRPIIYTQAFQAFFIIAGGFALLYYMLKLSGNIPDLGSQIPTDHFKMIKSISDENFPWLAMLVALPFIGIWYHCADAEMAQKFFAGKNLEHSQASTVFLAYLKLMIIPIVMIPAILAVAVYPEVDSALVFPEMVKQLPSILKGIAIAGFLAAAMSSLAASYNACSTLYTFDIYLKLYPKAHNFILINIGKIATIFIVILSINWVVLMRVIKGDLFHHAASGFAYMAPSIVVVYLMGILWERATAMAATITLILGGTIGIGMIVLEILTEARVVKDGFLFYMAHLSFFYVALIFFAFFSVLLVIISLLDKAPAAEKVATTTFQSYLALTKSQEPSLVLFRKRTNIASFILLGIIVTFYLFLA